MNPGLATIIVSGSFFTLVVLGVYGVIKFFQNEQKAKKLRQNLKVGDRVEIRPESGSPIIASVAEIKNDNLKSVVVSVTTTLDKIYPVR